MEDTPETVWRVVPPDPEAARQLARDAHLSPLTAQVLLNRGVSDPEAAYLFLHPDFSGLADPYQLPDMEKAVERLCRALDSGERIFLHGDYDADGVTSTALCQRALQILKGNVIGFVPKRGDGYDLQKSGVDKAREAGASLILTADCGSCAHEAIAYANSLGMEVIVTDHHRPEEELPKAYALVNPYREDADVAFKALCGAGVAFKLFDALFARRMPEARAGYRQRFADLAALGTVADVTPLVGENRILVTLGLEAMRTSRKPGIQALLTDLKLKGKELTSRHISMNIAPHLNAAGRMDDAAIAFRLLATHDPEEARELIAQMAELRERSRTETDRVTQEALLEAIMPEQQGRRVLVLARERWGKGVVGIAANKVVEHTRRPVILLAYDRETNSYGGSARTYGDFHLLAALRECRDLLGRFGGHSASAGVSVPAQNLEAFRERIDQVASSLIPEVPEPPTLEIDAEILDGSQVTFPLAQELELLQPFGVGNPEPVFVSRRALLLETRWVGRDGATLSARIRLPGAGQALKGLRFGSSALRDWLEPGKYVDVVFTPQLNDYNGVHLQLYLHDLRLSDS